MRQSFRTKVFCFSSDYLLTELKGKNKKKIFKQCAQANERVSERKTEKERERNSGKKEHTVYFIPMHIDGKP